MSSLITQQVLQNLINITQIFFDLYTTQNAESFNSDSKFQEFLSIVKQQANISSFSDPFEQFFKNSSPFKNGPLELYLDPIFLTLYQHLEAVRHIYSNQDKSQEDDCIFNQFCTMLNKFGWAQIQLSFPATPFKEICKSARILKAGWTRIFASDYHVFKEVHNRYAFESEREYYFCSVTGKDCHPGLLDVYQIFFTHNSSIIVTPRYHGGDLFQYVMMHKNKDPDFNQKKKRIFIRLVHNLCYLHSLGIAHRDVKPENIFMPQQNDIDSNDSPCIGDFGSASVVQFFPPCNQNEEDQNRAQHPYSLSQVISSPFHLNPHPQNQLNHQIMFTTSDQSLFLPRFFVSLEKIMNYYKSNPNNIPELDPARYVDSIFSQQQLHLFSQRLLFPWFTAELPPGNGEFASFQKFQASQSQFPLEDDANLRSHYYNKILETYEFSKSTTFICFQPLSPQLYALLLPDDVTTLHSYRFHDIAGTLQCMAPEILQYVPSAELSAQLSLSLEQFIEQQKLYSDQPVMGYDAFKADIFSLGHVLFFLAYDVPLFSVRNCFPEFPIQDQTMSTLLNLMLSPNPKHRPTIVQILKHLPKLKFPPDEKKDEKKDKENDPKDDQNGMNDF